MTTAELIQRLTDVSRWFTRGIAMVAANEEHTNCISDFSKAARACGASGGRALGKLKQALNEEGEAEADAPALPLNVAVRPYVNAVGRGSIRWTVTHKEAGGDATCTFRRARPEAHPLEPDEVLGLATADDECHAVLCAFVDLVANYALEDGKLVKRDTEEGDDDGE